MRLLLVTAACAAVFALPAFADQPAPAAGGPTTASTPTATPVSSAPKADEGVVCKMKQVTGTRFSKKVCTTKAQRDAEAAEGRDMLTGPRPDPMKPPGG